MTRMSAAVFACSVILASRAASAPALDVEIRQRSGDQVSPDGRASEELKLLALRELMNSDPDRAIPMVEQLLADTSTVRVKETALFVLSQSRVQRARDRD